MSVARQKAKMGLVPIRPVAGRLRHVATERIYPSPENESLYRPVNLDDPEIIALAESIREKGILEPLVVTRDYYIVSGHRRHAAAILAGLATIPCRMLPIRRRDDTAGFVQLLREHNRQRDKSNDERLREELVSVDPDEAYQSLILQRSRQARIDAPALEIQGEKRRAEISAAKRPFVEAILGILKERREYLPLSDRAIHYALLNDPPLRHASKPRSVYRNDKASYKSLVELLTRLRLAGIVPMEAIADETRPIVIFDVHPNPRQFVRRELGRFLKHFWRDLQQSQPNHIEIIGEKNTVAPILKPVAAEYCIPLTTGRGYCSLPPRHKMAERYFKSGRNKLIVLIVSDFDPDGEEIAQSFARSLRDDFNIDAVHPIKVALTAEQVEQFNLPPSMEAKESSAQYGKFAARHGRHAYELEALPPAELQGLLREAIDSVLDVAAFNREIDAEKADAAWLAGVRKRAHSALADVAAEPGEEIEPNDESDDD
jgi:hypothetical protein